MNDRVFWLCCAIGLLPIIHSKQTQNPGDPGECLSEAPILQKYLPKITPLPEKNGELAEATYGDSYFICQNDDNKDQYISLFSKKHNMVLFSAFIYEEVVQAGRGTRPQDWKTPKDDFPSKPASFKHPVDDDYTVFSDFNRGHLFPHNFAKDEAQGKATMRHTNAVPQDAVFNKWIWKYSEDHLKAKFLERCHGDGNVATVVTGAVPGFYGLDEKKENVKEINLRIGMADGLNKWNERFPVTKWDKNKANIAMQGRLTVPTHMWTYFICVKKGTEEILDQASYIGLNYRTGVVKWYNKITDFAETLGKMYGSKFTINEAKPLPEPSGTPSGVTKVCLSGEVLDTETMKCKEGSPPVNEIDFWDKVNLHEIRKTNEKHRLIFQLTLFGLDVEREADNYVIKFANSDISSSTGSKMDVSSSSSSTWSKTDVSSSSSSSVQPNPPKKFKCEESKRSDRRKRSTSKDTSDIESAMTTLEIIDQDQDRDFVLKECTILEKSCDGEIQEEHVYNLEHNTFIEDKKTDIGTSWTASHLENGEKVEATKKVSNIYTIDIILKPRD